MGRYVNPGNEGFVGIVRGRYVDKTGLITAFDSTLDITDEKLVMVSRPRRFGKSYAAQAIAAFYSCGCDSRSLFEGLEVAKHEGWDAHLNQYNVVWLDMTGVIETAGSVDVVPELRKLLLAELRVVLPGAGAGYAGGGSPLKDALWDVAEATGRKFIFIIDEWDAPYRLAQGDAAAQDAYAEWLRGLFKDLTFTPKVIAGAYMTGILPIKKYNHQSAVSDFREYTMLDAAQYSPFVGFVDSEVEDLCEEYDMDLADVRRWYDGYRLSYSEDLGAGARPRFRDREIDVYAPYSLMRACVRRRTGSYWPSTETFDSLREYIDMDFDGLQGAVLRAVAGEELRLDPTSFQNDLTSMRSAADVLTLLVHLGYLSYEREDGTDVGRARVPNEEVRRPLRRAIESSSHVEVARIVRDSIQLVRDLLDMDEEAVAAGIQRAHDGTCAPQFYNDEQALRAVVRAALIAAVDDWARVEELSSGHGLADVAFLPKRGSSKPALLVELKWDKPVTSALDQIHDRNYPQVLRDLDVPVLLVGITYDARTKKHVCRIEPLAHTGVRPLGEA